MDLHATDVPTAVRSLRTTFQSGRTRSLDWRRRQLGALDEMLERHEDEFLEALARDLGKPAIEAYAAEVGFVRAEIRLTRKKLSAWAKPRPVRTNLLSLPGKSRIYPEPYGLVLIIGPWNYPLQLVAAPLVGAIAAGNCAIIKPSEVTPHVSAAIARRFPEYLDPDCVRVVEGGVPETTALLAERFDYIFYTGNGTVGRIVMRAAAEHLTPVTLELGGKSPCIVDHDATIDVTARRIVWGKFYNAGQTCVAPDYVLVHQTREAELLEAMKQAIREFYGADPRQSPDYARIVNERHHARVMRLVGSGDVVTGGVGDAGERYLAPTILRNVPLDSPAMTEEIFGPVLPVLAVPNVDAAIELVNARDKPLALYLYSESPETQARVLRHTSSGGACINHAWLHLSVPALPFGGVGESGMGAYHGQASFDTFSHLKSVLIKPTRPDPDLLYPPYTKRKVSLVRRVL